MVLAIFSHPLTAVQASATAKRSISLCAFDPEAMKTIRNSTTSTSASFLYPIAIRRLSPVCFNANALVTTEALTHGTRKKIKHLAGSMFSFSKASVKTFSTSSLTCRTQTERSTVMFVERSPVLVRVSRLHTCRHCHIHTYIYRYAPMSPRTTHVTLITHITNIALINHVTCVTHTVVLRMSRISRAHSLRDLPCCTGLLVTCRCSPPTGAKRATSVRQREVVEVL
jgi:hypothetical protein